MHENVININRVAKVVKGGRRFSFTALVVIGDWDIPEDLAKNATAQRGGISVFHGFGRLMVVPDLTAGMLADVRGEVDRRLTPRGVHHERERLAGSVFAHRLERHRPTVDLDRPLALDTADVGPLDAGFGEQIRKHAPAVGFVQAVPDGIHAVAESSRTQGERVIVVDRPVGGDRIQVLRGEHAAVSTPSAETRLRVRCPGITRRPNCERCTR